jgi:P63C domain
MLAMSDGHTLGKAAGGHARAEALSPEKRQEIAKRAAEARWGEGPQIPRVTHRGVLEIGGTRIRCAVLDTGQRVISENAITLALLGSRSGASKRLKKASGTSGAPIPLFLAPGNLKPYISKELEDGPLKPVVYRDQRGTDSGYDATLLPAVCNVWLAAREAGALQEQQQDKAQKAEILMRGLAEVGIIALVDEATGYQEVRDRLALQAILDAVLARELAAWAKRFPDEFYQHIFRLRGWQWKGRGTNPPQVVAYYTNDFVYDRLAPGVLDELRRRNPVNEHGSRRAKHHQWLTEDVGHPMLAQHLHAVIALMRIAPDWDTFQTILDRAFPKRGNTLQLPFPTSSNAQQQPSSQ